jgi:outer membrane protein OmpA-like peptidoglycan-associated protein
VQQRFASCGGVRNSVAAGLLVSSFLLVGGCAKAPEWVAPLEGPPATRAEAQLQEPEQQALKFSLSADLAFDYGKAELKPDGSTEIGNIRQLIPSTYEGEICVRGFTDGPGSELRNQILSERRAKSVAAALVAVGIRNSIQIQGLGEIKANGSIVEDPTIRIVEILIGSCLRDGKTE